MATTGISLVDLASPLPTPTASTTHYTGPLPAHYHEAYFTVLGSSLCTEAFRGQSNGLCGAAAPNQLTLRFGVHTGRVNISVLLSQTEPPLNERWDEIVEVPLLVDHSVHLSLMDFDGDPWGDEVSFEAGSYRARFSVKNFVDDEASTSGIDDLNDSAQDYELIVWPSPPRPDTVLKTTGSLARHYHSNQ